MKNNKGMALIMAVAIVGILAGIATTFAYNMRIDQKAAGNYMYFVKARYLAEAGIARGVAELINDAQNSNWHIAEIDRLYNSSLDEVWADGADFSGATNGILGEGYFDLRYARVGVEGSASLTTAVYSQLDETSDDKVNGHVTNGIIDEERKININTANSTLLQGLPGIGPTIATNIIAGQPDYNTITELLTVTDIGADLLYADDDGSGTNCNNHKLDSGETNDAPSDVLNGGIEDLITVSTDSITDGSSATISPVNVNTAPETVLKAIINGVTGISDTETDTVVKAILEYRSGKDYDDDSNIGDGNPNPFDGIDQNRNDGIDPNVSTFPDPGGDDLDNDDDGTTDEADEAYMFAGGPRGEFNALIDYVNSTGYNGGNTISSADAVNIMDNADPAGNVDYDGDGIADNSVDTTSFIFNSKYFQIISTGVVQRSDVTLAEQKIMQIVGPIE